MKDNVKFLHGVLCMVFIPAFIGMACSPHVTKGQFIGAGLVYAYMILILVAFDKKD